MPRLIVTRPGETVRSILLAGEVTIGRDPRSVVALADDGVSGHHARITANDGGTWLEDLGSRNGTNLEGVRVPPNQRIPLVGGERMTIGPYLLAFSADNALDRSGPIDTGDDAGAPVHNVRSIDAKGLRVLKVVAFLAVLAALAAIVFKQVV
jgi:pSer/pThr/pTyr-binding forkhead associated (FHA) protein